MKASLRSRVGLTVLFLLSALASVARAAQIEVSVGLTPAGDFKAKTSEIHGQATVEPSGDRLKIKAENIVVPLKSLKTGIPLRDRHMRENYLETDKFPEVVLISAEGQDGKGRGRIKLRGIEKEIVGTYSLKGDELTADFPLQLSDFGISGIKYLGVGVNDQILIRVVLPAVRK